MTLSRVPALAGITSSSANKILVICQSVNSDMLHLYDIKKSISGKDFLFADDASLNLQFQRQPNRASALLRVSNWTAILPNLYNVFRQKVTHVLFDDHSPFYLIYGLFFRVMGLRLIYTLHDQVAHEGRGARAMNIYIWLVSRLLADEIVVFSPCRLRTRALVNQMCLGGYHGERLTVGPAPTSNMLEVLIFGRIKQYKGYEHLSAIASLTEQMPVRYRVVGTGDEELLQPLQGRPNITLDIRYIQDAEIPKIFAEADINLLPYNTGTQSGVAILSASFGVPTLAFDVGSLKDYIHRGIGTVVPERTYEMVVRELEKYVALTPAERNELRFQTRRSYDENFSSRELVNCYERLKTRLTSKSV